MKKKIIAFVCFILIIAIVFSNITYLFRINDYNRENMVGIKSEDNLDVVYVGGSSAYVYWQPYRAWSEHGFTSYCYATDAIQAESIKYYISEARKYQDPELFVVDLHPFRYWTSERQETFRKGSDGMSLLSWNRIQMIRYYLKHRENLDGDDDLSYYLDISKYHTKTDVLDSEDSWNYIRNTGASSGKGYQCMDYYAYIQAPEDYVTDERAELPEAELSVLTDLLEYCKSEQLAVVFTLSPYYITKDDWALFNTIGDVIESYGYPYFNANAYYEEMGIDFGADFYNRSHVNYRGAAKYTTYFADYLVSVSDLPDHREDAAYSSWADGADTFFAWEPERIRYVKNMADTVTDEYLAEQMRGTTNFSEWSSIAKAWRFTLLVSQNGTLTQPRKAADQSILEIYGLYDSDMYGSIRVLESNAVVETNYLDGAESISGTIGVNEVPYTIENKDQNTSIVVDGAEYGNSEDDVVIVVVDNLLGKVVDTVNLKLSKKKIKLERLEEAANE